MHCWIGSAGRNFFVDGREVSTGDPQSSRAELDRDTGVKLVFLIYEIKLLLQEWQGIGRIAQFAGFN
jgi:hypothetical protein